MVNNLVYIYIYIYMYIYISMKVDSQSIIEATGPISISKSILGNKVWGRCIRFYLFYFIS